MGDQGSSTNPLHPGGVGFVWRRPARGWLPRRFPWWPSGVSIGYTPAPWVRFVEVVPLDQVLPVATPRAVASFGAAAARGVGFVWRRRRAGEVASFGAAARGRWLR